MFDECVSVSSSGNNLSEASTRSTPVAESLADAAGADDDNDVDDECFGKRCQWADSYNDDDDDDECFGERCQWADSHDDDDDGGDDE